MRSRDERSISPAKSCDDSSTVRIDGLELMRDFEDEKRLSLIMISFSFWAILTWRFMCPRGSLAPPGILSFFLFLLRSYISPQKIFNLQFPKEKSKAASCIIETQLQ